ncbi:ESX secretion-associated protein EspG [Nocardia sp. CDC159]|uniref:ESX secretion-associated protein EspG n=1 Tax=Nocardia pulmonis TaxID=2951408 RepID=A0A9X2E7Q3_9NOCA|nr:MULTISPECIES: ESX secretion-associated protein EspG [Nocardia]MCM6775294.1 ESX secretion-associated protein EspG [Nocardia pulmonis]MCM6787972.1 ESX secretion-associated protein EspG [Nocardia sp. CDC159]
MDGLTFTIALEAFGRDRLPYPLRYLPEGFDALDDYQRARAESAQRLAETASERLYRALEVLLNPQVRVEMHGFYGPDLGRVVRVHAGMVGRIAALAVQLPGSTREYGGDIILLACAAAELPGHLAANLPKCPPGTRPPITARRSDLETAEYARDPIHLSHNEKLNRIVRRKRSSIGEVGVFPGPALDARPTTDGRGFHWMDYQPRDGRYLLLHHGPEDFTLTPGSPDTLTRHLHDLLLGTRNAVVGR